MVNAIPTPESAVERMVTLLEARSSLPSGVRISITIGNVARARVVTGTVKSLAPGASVLVRSSRPGVVESGNASFVLDNRWLKGKVPVAYVYSGADHVQFGFFGSG